MAKRVTSPGPSSGLPKYVAYYRVSTRGQGESGLGLEAQKAAVAGFVKGVIVAEYTEIESGKNNQRVELGAAIERAKQEKAVLVIAKLDRLSRNASFIFTLRDSGVNFQCVDMPDANTLTIGIFATLAQHERELISSRTKAALQAKIAQGCPAGYPPESDGLGPGQRSSLQPTLGQESSRVAQSRRAGQGVTQSEEDLRRNCPEAQSVWL